MTKTIVWLAAFSAAAPVGAAVIAPLRTAVPAFGSALAAAPSAFAVSGPAASALSAAPAVSAAPALSAPVAAPAASLPMAAAPIPLAAAPVTAAPALDGLRAAASQPADPAGRVPLDAGRARFDGAEFAPPDSVSGWYDQHTGAWETQTSKIKKAYDLALTHPLAAGIKNALSRNTVYRVDNSLGDWYLHTAVRTQGDDNEKTNEPDALVVFNHNALVQLSPEFLAAKLASMWVRHLYRDTLPASAEKTYIEGSVMVRVFMGLSGSTAQNWNGDKDYFIRGTFELYRHFYHWIQGFRFANVRQGPYFLNKIMRAEGDPSIDADARGRMTLYQRAQAGQIGPEAAEAAQHRFDGFVSNEQH